MRPLMSRCVSHFLVFLMPFLLCTCGGSSPAAPPDSLLVESYPEAMRTPGWLEFSDLSLHTNAEATPPLEPYVRGMILGGLFFPTGSIVGPKKEPSGRRARFLLKGWLDLRTRAFYPTGSQHQHKLPYVEGAKDRDSGGFHPTADIVHGTKVQGQ